MSNYSATGSGYLEATVLSAPPARLRLMLIERAEETAARLIACWRAGESLGSNEYSLTLLDLFTELLNGVTGDKSETKNELCDQISDLYVFLAKHLVASEETSDFGSIEEIKLVLSVEAETWRAVCVQESTVSSTVPSGSPTTCLNLQG